MIKKSLETIKFSFEDVLETLSYYEFEESRELFIGLIKIKKEFRNQGHGTLILNHICDYADLNGLTITLTPLSYNIEEQESYSNKPLFNLERFYSEKFGFVLNEEENELPHIKDKMYRLPKMTIKKNKSNNDKRQTKSLNQRSY